MTTKEAAPKSTQSKRNPLDYPIATSLITEFTPKHHRAISMGMVSAAWYLGATVAAVVGFALCDVDGGWRLMLGSAIVPCVFLLIGRCKVPESPLWLKSKGRHEEARRVVFRAYGADVILEDEEEEPKHKAGFAEVFSKGYAARIVFWGSSRCARSFPCTLSTRSVHRLCAPSAWASGRARSWARAS